MSIVPVSVSAVEETFNAVRLARYAQLIEQPECSVWGVRNPADELKPCEHIWSHGERVNAARYLGEAQLELEQVAGYPLSPKYFVGEQHDVTRQAGTCLKTFRARWLRVTGIGVQAFTTIALGAAVNHATDPAVVGPIATPVTDPTEIRVYHPGTDSEVVPSSVVIAGGNVTISIPRCRLVLAALEETTPSDGLDYADTLNFEATVDVKREYLDASNSAVFVYPHQVEGETCRCACGCACGELTQEACAYIRDTVLGWMDAQRSSNQVPTCATCYCRVPSFARVNYRAGYHTLTTQAEDAIVRLAHVKMPRPPCGCDTAMEMWKRDRNEPESPSRERLGCPFGLSDGAWTAWKFANALSVKRVSVI